MEGGAFAGDPVAAGSVEEEADGMMTFFQQGFAIFRWGPPPEDLVNKLNDALASETSSEGQFFWRGKYRSPLSEALIDFVMQGISEETKQYIHSLLQQESGEEESEEDEEGGENVKRLKPGEPIFVDCGKAMGPPDVYRLGPYGYDRGQALCLMRKVRGTVRFQVYPGSQLQDREQIQQQRLHPAPLELELEHVVMMDSDLCFDWPLDGSDGCFVGITFAKGDQRISIQRDHPVMDVAPFHASPSIRRIESLAKAT